MFKQAKKTIVNLIWLMILAAFVIAFFRVNNIKDAGDLWGYAKVKSDEIRACIRKSGETNSIQCSLSLKVGNYHKDKKSLLDFKKKHNLKVTEKEQEEAEKEESPKEDTSPLGKLQATKLTKKESFAQLDGLNVVEKYDDVKYSRAEWKHWSPQERSCWNTREAALANQAKEIALLDKNKEETKDINNACSIMSGKWLDPLSGKEFTKAGSMDVDHIVPLMVAAKSGAQNWDKEQKEKYANDLDILIVTSAKQNRSKGAKTPSEWMPPKKESHCNYAKIYINTLSKYKLNITEADKKALNKAIASCEY